MERTRVNFFFFGCWSHLDPGRTWGNVLFFATCSQYCTNADSFDQRSLHACSQFLGRRLFFVDALYERKIAHPTDPRYSNTRCCSPKKNGFEAILDAKCYFIANIACSITVLGKTGSSWVHSMHRSFPTLIRHANPASNRPRHPSLFEH